jgi:hypothetical protein
MASELKVNKITPESGLTLTLGDSGDTINFGSGVLPNFENLTVTGDLTVDTNSLKVDSTNNFVGIGTASPTVALDVVGAITATGNITGTLATAAQPNITSLGTLTGLTTAGNINLGDNDKINLGASNDLQIYHDGSHSIIADAGTGNLEFRGTHLVARNGGDTGNYFQAIDGAQVELYYNGSSKMSTTSTGINVTGTVVSDGLTVDGGGSFTQAGGGLKVFNNGTAGYNANIFFGISDQTDGWSIGQGITANDGVFRVYDNGAGRARMAVTTDGDISFYEDTGTTPKFFWDASAESLGIGTTSPFKTLHTYVASGNAYNVFEGSLGRWVFGQIGDSHCQIGGLYNFHSGIEIDTSGNVGIGTSSPTSFAGFKTLELNNSSGNAIELVTGTGVIAQTIASNTNSLVYIGSRSNHDLVITTNDAERMRIDNSGNVLIGTTSQISSAKLSVSGTIGSGALIINTGSATNVFTSYTNNGTSRFVVSLAATETGSNVGSDLYFNNYNDAGAQISTPMMIKRSSSNVGIGTISPASTTKLQVAGVIRSASADGTGMFNLGDATGPAHNVGIFRGTANSTSSGNWLNLGGYDGISFAVSNAALGSQTERMRITNSGALLVGTTSYSSTSNGTAIDGTNLSLTSNDNFNITLNKASGAGQPTYIFMGYNNGLVGYINYNGAGGVNYNSSSDYRLKENVIDLANATARVKQLKPKRFNFIASPDITLDGFLAHEVSDIVPEAISGTKDEVDADGNPVYQGIDQSKIVPLLVASLQEALTEIDNLKARVNTLEGN